MNPTHFDEVNGVLKPSAVGDVEYLGLSTNRLAYTDLDWIRRTAGARAEARNAARPDDPPRALIGYSTFRAGDARRIQVSEGMRAFGVYDTAKPDDPSHADVCQLAPQNPKHAARSARAQLRTLMVENFHYFE